MCYVIHLVLFLTLVRNEAVTSAAADDKKMGNPLHCDWVPECYCRASGEEYRVDCTDPELEEVPWNLPSNITELYISGTNLELLHEFSFYNYSDLRELDLSANKITEVEQRAFHQQFKLEVLVLRGNPELSVLDPGSFTPLINLHTLELSQCSLTQIPFRMNLPLLERLDMKDNDIEDVPTSTFQTCPSLLDINLENNNINNLGNNAFSGTSSLQRLFLRNNEISDIQQQDFGTLESLEILDISDNSIPQLDNNIFRDLESLNILYLQDNAIASLGSNAFSGLSSLTQLHLDNNALQEVPDIPSDHLPSLRTLKLSGNAIGTIPLNAFKDVGQIVDLSIGRMTSLTFIEDGAFSGMSALSSLDLRGNPNLQNLGVDALPDSEHETLEYIYLQDNAFVYLDERLFQSKDRLTYVDLFNNPFNCSCDLKWMPRVVEDNVPWASHWRSSTTPPRCKTPSHLENARIPDMKETDMTCDAPEVERISPETQTAHLMQNMSFVVSRNVFALVSPDSLSRLPTHVTGRHIGLYKERQTQDTLWWPIEKCQYMLQTYIIIENIIK